METNIELTENIRRAINESGLRDSAVAVKTGIPYSTLHNRLKGTGGWKATEIVLIADAIRVLPSTLLPSAFFAKVDA